MIIHIYNEFESIPPKLRAQWRRLRIKKYKTVPHFEYKWAKGQAAAVTFLLSEDSKILLAWAMGITFPHGLHKDDGLWDVPSGRVVWHLVVYVRKTARKQGHGNRVMTALRGFIHSTYDQDPYTTVYPHDTASAKFMIKHKLIDRNECRSYLDVQSDSEPEE